MASGGWGWGKVVTQQRQSMSECGTVTELSSVSPKAPQIYTYVYEPSWNWPPMENSQFYCFTTENKGTTDVPKGPLRRGKRSNRGSLVRPPGLIFWAYMGGETKSFWCDSNRHRTRLSEAVGKPPGLNVQVHGGPGSPGQPELPGGTIPSLWLQNPWQDGQCLGRGDMLVSWGGLTTLGRWRGGGQSAGQLSELKIQGNGCSPPRGWPRLRGIPPGAAGPLYTLATSRRGTHLHAEIQDEVSRASPKDLSSLLLPSGRVCPPVDSHVLSVSGGPLLHRVVRPVPALHGCDRRAEEDTHHHGAKLDDHCRATPYF